MYSFLQYMILLKFLRKIQRFQSYLVILYWTKIGFIRCACMRGCKHTCIKLDSCNTHTYTLKTVECIECITNATVGNCQLNIEYRTKPFWKIITFFEKVGIKLFLNLDVASRIFISAFFFTIYCFEWIIWVIKTLF